jgi:hypothetical protein
MSAPSSPVRTGIPIREFLGKIQAAGKEGDWLGHCPIHADQKASLHVTLSGGKILLHCFVCGGGNAYVADLRAQGLWPITLDGVVINSPGVSGEAPKVDLTFIQVTDENPPRVPIPQGYSGTKIHEYRSISGKLIGTVTRFETAPIDGSKPEKTFRPTFYFMDDGKPVWKTKAPSIRPLYGQQTLSRSGSVIIVEGEKTQEAAAQVFPNNPVVSPMGGLQGLSKSDLGVLQGRVVVIWSDADLAWQRNAAMWATILAPIVHEISIVQIPQWIVDKYPKWDLADPIPDYPKVVRKLFDEAISWLPSGQRAVSSIKKAEDLLEKFVLVNAGMAGFEFVYTETNLTLSKPQFEGYFNQFTRPRFGSSATQYFIENNRNGMRLFEGYEYVPQDKQFLRMGDRWCYNCWIPTTIQPREGSINPFLDHLNWLLSPEDAQELLFRFGNMIQNPRNRPTSLYLLQGSQGLGKNIIFNVFEELVGEKNFYAADPSSIMSGFNSFMVNKVMVIINEFTDFNKSEFTEHIKSLITEKRISVRQKYMNEYLISNYTHFFAMTNLERPVNLVDDDRRFYVAKCLPVSPRPTAYYEDLASWLDSHLPELLHFFQNMDLEHYSPKAIPAMTEAKAQIIEKSRKMPQRRLQAMIDADEDGPLKFNMYTRKELYSILEANGLKEDGNLKQWLEGFGAFFVNGMYIYKYSGRNYKKTRSYVCLRPNKIHPNDYEEVKQNPDAYYRLERDDKGEPTDDLI